MADNIMILILKMKKLKLIQDHPANKGHSQDSKPGRLASWSVLLTSILICNTFPIQSFQGEVIFYLFGQMKKLIVREVK